MALFSSLRALLFQALDPAPQVVQLFLDGRRRRGGICLANDCAEARPADHDAFALEQIDGLSGGGVGDTVVRRQLSDRGQAITGPVGAVGDRSSQQVGELDITRARISEVEGHRSNARAWQKARQQALSDAEVASQLARRPYDLRHAAVSLWLNAGVPATQVAEWAGHSVNVLLRVYAKCVDGQADAAKRRIAAALAFGDTEASANTTDAA